MSPVEALTRIRALAAKADGVASGRGRVTPQWVRDVRAVLDAVPVDATPTQESHYFGDGCGIEVQRDKRHLPPLTMDDLVKIAARIEVPRPVDATPARGIVRDALLRLLDEDFGHSEDQEFYGSLADRILALVRPVEGESDASS